MILRPYQQQAVESALEHLETHRSTLLVCPTGCGKTLMFAEIIRRMAQRGRAMVIAHREELLDQAREKIEAMTGLRPDLEMADVRASEGMFRSPIVVSSVQTQTAGRNGKRMQRFDPQEFGLLVLDEAHHAPAETYRAVVDHYSANPSLKVLGVTATPDRLDKKALGEIFESVAFDYEIVDAINEGWLVPIRQKFLSVQVDFSGVRMTLGDLNGADLRECLAKGDTLERIASDSIQWAGERRTLVFSDCVQNAERLTETYNRHRLGCARIVTGETERDERRTLIAAYRAGAFQFLVNVGIAGEGFDAPIIACVVQAAPTCSRARYAQQTGRGTRPLPCIVDGLDTDALRVAAIAASDKPDLLLLDIVGNSAKHKLMTAADILGGRYADEVVAAAEASMRESALPSNVAEALEAAERKHNAQIEAEAARKEKLKLRDKSHGRDVDPFGVLSLSRGAERGWDDNGELSEHETAMLDKNRVDGWQRLAVPEARQVIEEIRRRARRDLCSYRMARLLKRRGYDTRNMGFAEARGIIAVLERQEGWARK